MVTPDRRVARDPLASMARWAAVVATLLALLTTTINAVVFAARLSPALDHLTEAVRALSSEVASQETRLSRIEGRMDATPYPSHR